MPFGKFIAWLIHCMADQLALERLPLVARTALGNHIARRMSDLLGLGRLHQVCACFWTFPVGGRNAFHNAGKVNGARV